jgi:hypothetical protein
MTDTQTTISPDEQRDRTDGPIHHHFGLTYSNYQVLHRTFMQSMPVEWQQRMVTCLDELAAAFRHVEQADAFQVTAAVECYYSDLSDDDMRELGVTRSDTDPSVFYDRDGTEWEADDRLLVPRPGGDPVHAPKVTVNRWTVDAALAEIERRAAS